MTEKNADEKKCSNLTTVVTGVAGLPIGAAAGSMGFPRVQTVTETKAATEEQRLPGWSLLAKWDKEADLIVVGSGAAGICAALEAVEKGDSVVLAEQGTDVGGNSIISGGSLTIGGGTRIQKLNGIQDSADKIFADATAAAGTTKRNDPKLMRVFADYNLPTYDWLEAHGVRFVEEIRPPRGHWIRWDREGPGWLHCSTTLPYTVSGAGVVSPLEAAARSRGVEILLGHKMTKILRESEKAGRVLGVEVQAGGNKLYFKAKKAVILGAGGWKNAKFLRTLYDPRIPEAMVASGNPFVNSDGSAQLAALEVGAVLHSDYADDHHSWHRMFGTRYYRFPPGSPWAAPGLGRRSHPGIPQGAGRGEGQLLGDDWANVIVVNKSGLRYVNEGGSESQASEFYDPSLAQPDHVLWVIYDDAAGKRQGFDATPPTVEKDLAFSAPTISELAKLINVPGDALADTVRKYNTYVDQGEDPDFGKPKTLLKYKIETPPFWAVWMSLQVHNSYGGLHINEKCQVKDMYGHVIPGLYAAGETTGGNNFTNMSRAVITGRIASDNAVAETPWA